MANTYTQLYTQYVFAVKGRENLKGNYVVIIIINKQRTQAKFVTAYDNKPPTR